MSPVRILKAIRSPSRCIRTIRLALPLVPKRFARGVRLHLPWLPPPIAPLRRPINGKRPLRPRANFSIYAERRVPLLDLPACRLKHLPAYRLKTDIAIEPLSPAMAIADPLLQRLRPRLRYRLR